MTDENAIKLAEAINRLAAAIERVTGPSQMGFGNGIQVNHSGLAQYQNIHQPGFQGR